MHHLDDTRASGYSYVYNKTYELSGSDVLITRSLKNTGRHPIIADAFTHNFLTLDHRPPGPGRTISVPFTVDAPKKPPGLAPAAEVKGKTVAFLQTITGRCLCTHRSPPRRGRRWPTMRS